MKNTLQTYFLISGDFDPAEATKALRLEPDQTWRAGDAAPDGRSYKFDGWKFGVQDDPNEDAEILMMRTLSDLMCRVDALNRFADEQDVRYWLRVNACVHPGEKEPEPAPTMDIMKFCCATWTEMDIRLHVEN